MKRIILLVTSVVLASGVFAQENWNGNRRAAITLNPVPLIVSSLTDSFDMDLGFEYAPLSVFSLKSGVRFSNMGIWDAPVDDDARSKDRPWMVRSDLAARWYPQARFVQDWFFSGSFQYQIASADYYGLNRKNATLQALSFFTGVGRKVVFFSTQRAAFAVEFSGEVGFRITSDIPDTVGQESWVASWFQGIRGPRLGVSIGAAF